MVSAGRQEAVDLGLVLLLLYMSKGDMTWRGSVYMNMFVFVRVLYAVRYSLLQQNTFLTQRFTFPRSLDSLLARHVSLIGSSSTSMTVTLAYSRRRYVFSVGFTGMGGAGGGVGGRSYRYTASGSKRSGERTPLRCSLSILAQ